MEKLFGEIKGFKQAAERAIDNFSHKFNKAKDAVVEAVQEKGYNAARYINTQAKYLIPTVEASKNSHKNDVLPSVLHAKPKVEIINTPAGALGKISKYVDKALELPGIKQVMQVAEKTSSAFSALGKKTSEAVGYAANYCSKKLMDKKLFDFDKAPKFKNIFNDAIEDVSKLKVSEGLKAGYKLTSKLGGVFKALAICDALYDGSSKKLVSVGCSIAVGAGTAALAAAAVATAPVTLTVAAAGAIIFVAGAAGGIGGDAIGERIGNFLDGKKINLRDNGLSLKNLQDKIQESIPDIMPGQFASQSSYMTNNNRSLPNLKRSNGVVLE